MPYVPPGPVELLIIWIFNPSLGGLQILYILSFDLFFRTRLTVSTNKVCTLISEYDFAGCTRWIIHPS